MQEIKNVFENQKQRFQENNAIEHMNLKPATLIRYHIFLEIAMQTPYYEMEKCSYHGSNLTEESKISSNK